MHILSADCAAELSSTFIFQAVILYNRAKVLPNVMNYSMIIYNFIMLTITHSAQKVAWWCDINYYPYSSSVR